MSELPSRWAEATLSQVADWGSGGTPSRARLEFYGGTIPWIKTGELGQGIITDTEEKITQQALENSSAKIFPKGSVAVAMYGATIGKVAILGIDAATNQACAVGAPIAGVITTNYLLHFLVSQRDAFAAKGQGGAQPNISQGIIKDWPIPLAPLREQLRIADKLDAVLARVDACRARLDRVPAILTRFREAVLGAAISGKLTEEWRDLNPSLVDASADVAAIKQRHADAGGHRRGNAAPPTNDVHDLDSSAFPSGWGLVEMRELVDPTRPITYGILKPGPELAGGVPYVRVADFPNERLNLGTIRRTSTKIDQEFARSRLRPGDLLLSIRGTVGRTIVVPPELNGANITQDSARLSIQETVELRYVLWFLRSKVARKRMHGAIKGVAVRGINIGDVRALQVPLPSRAEQREIVRRVEELLALADALDAKYRLAIQRVERFTPAVLAKAFRGKLTPQDPADEPAETLLKKMKATRESVIAATETQVIRRTRKSTSIPVKKKSRS